MNEEIIAMVISLFSLIISAITTGFSYFCAEKREFIKLYYEMISDDEIYNIMSLIEEDKLNSKDIANTEKCKSLDKYLSYIEMLLAYSLKHSKKYIIREIRIIRYNVYIWGYICGLAEKGNYPVYRTLKEKIIGIGKL